jgi:hypothetical protein
MLSFNIYAGLLDQLPLCRGVLKRLYCDVIHFCAKAVSIYRLSKIRLYNHILTTGLINSIAASFFKNSPLSQKITNSAAKLRQHWDLLKEVAMAEFQNGTDLTHSFDFL